MSEGGVASMSDRGREVAALAAMVALGAVMLWELVTLNGVPVARDMQMFFVPQRFLVWEALQQGRVPLWSPYYGTGAPLLANFQSGVFYPPHWLYAAFPFFAAFNLLIVFHFVVGGAGAYLLGRRISLSVWGSLAVGITFMLGGYFASLLNLINGLQAAAWAPLFICVVLWHLERRSIATFVALTGVLLLALLAGEPQTFLLTIGLAASFALLRWRDHAGEARALPLGAGLAAAGILVIGLAMIQILPTAGLIAESARGAGLTYGEASFFALEPIRLLHLVLPPDYSDPVYAFGFKSTIGKTDPWLFSVYLGALWLALLYYAAREPSRRRELIFWSVCAVGGLLLALGDHTPVFRLAFEHVPGADAFRYPEKYFFLTAIGAAMVAGYGFDALRARRFGRRDGLLSVLLLAGLLIVRVLWGLGRETIRANADRFVDAITMDAFDFAFGVWTQNLNRLIALVAIGSLLLWMYRSGRIERALFSFLLICVLGSDLLLAHRGLNPVVDEAFYQTEPAIGNAMPLDEVRRDYRYWATGFSRWSGVVRVVRGVPVEAQKWMWQQTVAPNTGQLHHVLQHDTWDAIKLRRNVDERDFLQILPDAERRWKLLRLNGVKYVYSLDPIAEGPFRAETRLDSIPGTLYELEEPVARATVVTGASFHEDEVAVINAVLRPEFDPSREVALIGPMNSFRAPGGDGMDPQNTSARILSDTGEEIRIAVSAPAGGHLVLTDSFYPGWEATVDGELREVRLANFFFREVALEPGDREVVFRYRSRPFEVGRRISLATLFLALSGLSVAAIRRRRPARD